MLYTAQQNNNNCLSNEALGYVLVSYCMNIYTTRRYTNNTHRESEGCRRALSAVKKKATGRILNRPQCDLNNIKLTFHYLYDEANFSKKLYTMEVNFIEK